MCYKYVTKKCSRGDSCEEGHDFKTNHNTKILQNFYLEDADSQLLLKLMQSSVDEVVVPEICDHYNVGECECGSECTEMHLCLNSILGTCNDWCLLNHDILEPQCQKLLKMGGVKTYYSKRDLKNHLRVRQKEQRLDAIMKQERRSSRLVEEASRRKVFHADEDDGEVEVPEILQNFYLEDADSQLLLKLMQSSVDEVVVPEICDHYNVGECECGSECTEMHLCLNSILGTCNDWCLLNHDILEPQCQKLLKMGGVKTYYSKRDLKNHLRVRQKEQRLDAIMKQERRSSRLVEEASRRKVFHADEDDGEVEVPEVCIFLLNDRCLDGERGRCKRLHAGMPYHWQVKNPVTNKWINLSKNQSFRLEQNFADPSKVKVQLDSFTSEEVHLTKRSQLRSLFQDESYEVDLNEVKNEGMKLRNMQTQAIMDIRRLSTESHVMTGGKKHSTIWCWYFLDKSGKWMEYGSTTAEHNSFSNLKSADIEKQFCTVQGSGCIAFSTNKFKYEVNFQTMKQKNLMTNVQRDIRRRPAPPDGSSNLVNVLKYRHVPSHWVPMQETETCKMVPLYPESQEYQNVASLMPGFTVRKITRVQNPYLWEMYQNKRLVLLKKYNNDAGKVNERVLFHGTPSQNIQSICEQNFDWRLHGTANGSVFGKGVYFATNPQISTGYSKGGGAIFAAKVLVGSAAVGKSSMARPPTGYDSTTGLNGSLFVMYYDQDYYPEYLVEF
ncbi:unnamed protein product [Darwinula stevensoni]|uniref:Poly [ADP-ribose] polymerase n=1 Tax=Darwinula stevensoni TaxID=69355 RepID=A0A7R9AAC5_9CRUS|nr:unnamed protein product [Darwinula stevensoni]CAG0898299.1 unnamed protein product [Darwinula stevensoni]